MGWLHKIFKRCENKGESHNYVAEDGASNDASSSTDGLVDSDMEETDRVPHYSFPDDGWRLNDTTDLAITVAKPAFKYYDGQYKIAPCFEEVEHPSLASQQHYHINFPCGSGSTYQLDPWFFPSYSMLPVCQTDIDYGLPHSSSVWNPEQRHHSHESYFRNTTYEDQFSENSTCHRINNQQTLRCYVCKNLLQTGVDGHLQAEEHAFWRQKYCPSHDHDGTPACTSCQRLVARDSNPLSFEDGRKICKDCQGAFIIMTIQEFQPIIREIQQLYEELEMKVERHFPIHLVDLTEIGEEDEDSAILCSMDLGVTVGSERSIPIEVGIPRIGQPGEISRIDKKSLKLVGNIKVNFIHVLNGLPRIFIGSILAHEMMHAWNYQEGYHINMDLEVSEGTCQVMSYIWLQSKVDSLSKSSFERKLGKFLMYEIETREDEYGNGFRRAKRLLDRYGLKETLNIIRFTGGFLDDFT